MTPWRAVFAGAGGQGVISAARLLALAAHRAGMPVAAGQLHGMAQRGGSVIATVVIGGGSSLVAPGSADALCGTEPLEALRALPSLRAGGLVVTNTRPLVPPALEVARAGYPSPDEILAALGAHARRVVAFDATALALAAGSAQAVNVVMLGALCAEGGCPVPLAAVAAALDSTRAGTRALNQRALQLGAGPAAT